MVESLVTSFNELGHLVVNIWNAHSSSSGKELNLILSKFRPDFKGFIVDNSLSEEYLADNGFSTEYLLHKVFLKRNDSKDIKSTRYYDLEALVFVDAHDIMEVNEEVRNQLILAFEIPSSTQRDKLEVSFEGLRQKYSFLAAILHIKVKILEVIPRILNLENSEFLYHAKEVVSDYLLDVHIDTNVVIEEQYISSSPIKERELINKEDILKLTSSTRLEDEELDALIIKENLQNINLSELEDNVTKVILDEDRVLMKEILELESSGSLFLEKNVKDVVENVLNEASKVLYEVNIQRNTLKEKKKAREDIRIVTEKTLTWLKNVRSLQRGISNFMSRYSLSAQSTKVFNELNQNLADIQDRINQEKMTSSEEMQVQKGLQDIHNLFNEMFLAIRGKNYGEMERVAKEVGNSNKFLDENMTFVSMQQEELEMSKLSAATNVQFVLLNIISSGCRELTEITLHFELGHLDVTFWTKKLDSVVHSKLNWFSKLIKSLPQTEFEHVRDTYKTEMSTFYSTLLTRSLDFLHGKVQILSEKDLELEVDCCQSFSLPDSAEAKEAIQQQYFENFEIYRRLRNSTENYSSMFEKLVMIFLELTKLESKFSPQFFFYYENDGNIVASEKSFGNKIRFGKRKVKFGDEDNDDSDMKVEENIFFEADTFLFDLFSSKFDIVLVLDANIWRTICATNIHYCTLIISHWLENELWTKRSSRRLPGGNYLAFMNGNLESLVMSWLKTFLNNELGIIEKVLLKKRGGDAITLIFKIPDFVHKVLAVVVKGRNSWIETSIIDFLHKIISLIKATSGSYTCDICYFLKHSISPIISQRDTKLSNKSKSALNSILDTFDETYQDKVNTISASVMIKYFKFLVDFNDEANRILSSLLSNAQYRDLVYHVPYENYTECLRNLTAAELDIRVLDKPGSKCWPCSSVKHLTLLQRLSYLRKELDENLDIHLVEITDVIKERVVSSLVENFTVFRDIGDECYQQHIQMSIESFEQLARRYIQTSK